MSLSRNEDILQSILDDEEYTAAPRSRMEELLIDVGEKIAGSGTGNGTVKSVNGIEPDEDGNVVVATGTPGEYSQLVTDVNELNTKIVTDYDSATTKTKIAYKSTGTVYEIPEMSDLNSLSADIEELSDGVDAVKEELAVLGLSIDEDGNIIDSWIEEE